MTTITMAVNVLNPLVNSVRWKAGDHPGPSRGRLAAGLGPSAIPRETNLVEDCFVMTRNPRILWFHRPRTKVFLPDAPAPWGILWWHATDDLPLADLHQICIAICSEAGFSEFCAMCQSRAPAATAYWREMLGAYFKYLRARS
ncbi:MAG TPA: hypothetical protein VHH73_11625 [Verrucomicrobiae bacterium]|nr:hypothetical protein [Verrucomicrobiae bacterium]